MSSSVTPGFDLTLPFHSAVKNELDHRVCKSVARGTTGPSHRYRGGLYKLKNEVNINSLSHCFLSAYKLPVVRVVKTKLTGIMWNS